MLRKSLVTICILVFSLSAQAQNEWVNPFIGSSNFGACNPGAVTPNGLMSVSPFNVMGSAMNTWDKDSRWWSTPYVAENSYFTGFSHVNLSGVGCPDLGSLLTMPTTGPVQVDYHMYGTEYKDEEAHPGYYSLQLLNGIKAEVSATTRTAIERYTFPGGQGNILLNLGEGLTNESGASVRRVSATEVEGSKLMGTFCYNREAVFPIYFVLRVSKVPSASGYWKKQRPMTAEAAWDADAGKYKLYGNYAREISGDDIGCWFHYDHLEEGEQVQLQLGVSFVSVENARENLDAEQQGFAFDAVRSRADALWAQHLGRVQVEGGTDEQKTVFYTALYHALIHPNVVSDVNGEYPLMEYRQPSANGGVGCVEPGHERYTVFSLWDTYRNLHQLMTLLWPEKQLDMVNSMIDMYREWGWMPKWELFGRETWTMEGDPAICVIADTWLRGLKDFDIQTAYQAFRKSADTPGAANRMRPDNDPYMESGYIPLGYFAADFSGDNSVSHALEYYVADYAFSRLARDLGREDDAKRFLARSLGYRHYYSPEYRSLRPLNADGTFLSPFNPEDGADFSNAPGFHEGSAWNYTFAVPHDVAGYAKLQGGTKAFVQNLQHVFDQGLYDPANEPDIVYPYLFSRFKGYEKRTWEQVDNILAKHYKNAPDGIPGNDDTGTMSAWAVFSMLGFYPDCPGEPSFTLTRPTFTKACITLPDGSSLTVSRSAKPSRALVGGKNAGFRISHSDLLKAGTIMWK
ncbi:MAG: GH92 family glycosyl hydrolase [Bacteroidales bacterium]|nr:GH92 family glycosyl hydrolase [Bacteroidales bacterium]